MRSSISRGGHIYHSREAVAEMGRIVRKSQTSIPYNASIILFDDKVLMISLKNNGVGYCIEDKIIFRTFKSLFQGMWKYSKIIA